MRVVAASAHVLSRPTKRIFHLSILGQQKRGVLPVEDCYEYGDEAFKHYGA